MVFPLVQNDRFYREWEPQPERRGMDAEKKKKK